MSRLTKYLLLFVLVVSVGVSLVTYLVYRAVQTDNFFVAQTAQVSVLSAESISE